MAVTATDGILRMYFDPEKSRSGIMNSIYKKAKRKEIDDNDYIR